MSCMQRNESKNILRLRSCQCPENFTVAAVLQFVFWIRTKPPFSLFVARSPCMERYIKCRQDAKMAEDPSRSFSRSDRSSAIKPFRDSMILYGCSGIITAAIKYTRSPVPQLIHARSAPPSRINVGSILKYSAIPPHTPQIILFSLDLYNFFCSIFLSPFLTIFPLQANVYRTNVIDTSPAPQTISTVLLLPLSISLATASPLYS